MATPPVAGRSMPNPVAAIYATPLARASPTRVTTPPADLLAPGYDEIDFEETGRVGQRAPMRTIGSAEMDTPHIQQSHPDTIDPSLVPAMGTVFSSVDEAHKFYLRYAYEVGFPRKRYRGRKNCKWLNCSMEGKCAQRAVDNPKLDDDGKIKSIFWSHASQQGEYVDFGDAVTFDTTHKTNLYEKPLGIFVGANNHLQCTTFGFVMLRDETIETFEWAFNAFKTCMGGDGPRLMLTDQDPAMPVALGRVFPNTIHRLCLLHGQNSESMNKVVKNCHVDANTPLHEFAKQMMKMIHERKMKETAKALACKGGEAYTRAVMNRFEESMKYSTAYKIVHDPDGGPDDYLVQHTSRSNKIVWGQFKVKANVEAGKYFWLLCVHLLKAFTHLQIEKIPKDYVMQRYTTSAKVDVLFEREDRKMQGKDGETALGRRNVVMLKTMKVVTISRLSDARKNMPLVVLDKLIEDMERVEPDIKCEENCINTDGREDCQVDDATSEEERGQCMAVQPNKKVSENQRNVLAMQDDTNADGEQQNANAGNAVVNGNSGQVTQPHDAIEARKRLSFAMEAISLEKPDRVKPKGRTIKDNEARVPKLGAKGEKKKNRRCKKCGIADGHNSRTCLSLEENRVRLANMVGRKRGRPPGSRNKSAISAAHWNETSTSKKRSVDMSDDEDPDDSDMETDRFAQKDGELQLSTHVLWSRKV
ncbi:hypothetical protein U9M48_024155 [Paspalum notatum var. saurae]|uniref:Protein FAR1-RELATED SEQUENCE n=1 Tax=Paspalum notatum var. saurae TaxID=547442 RepID=A0AAQ3TSB2_PASNO